MSSSMSSSSPSPRVIAALGILCGLMVGGLPGVRPERLLAAEKPLPAEGKLGHRSVEGRAAAVRYGGATQQSEAAVERGLRWLVAHQRDDGSWHFDHRNEGCMAYCTHPGSEASTTAATAMALLPLLGAGYTQQQGEYQDVIQRGLDYLRTRGVTIPMASTCATARCTAMPWPRSCSARLTP